MSLRTPVSDDVSEECVYDSLRLDSQNEDYTGSYSARTASGEDPAGNHVVRGDGCGQAVLVVSSIASLALCSSSLHIRIRNLPTREFQRYLVVGKTAAYGMCSLCHAKRHPTFPRPNSMHIFATVFATYASAFCLYQVCKIQKS